jgi:hypothetical protein
MTDTALAGGAQDWDQSHHGNGRFTVLAAFGQAAVRDNNTGLVWEKAPDATTWVWTFAVYNCANRNVGGTFGWRLPSVIELKSIQDPSLPAPGVPTTVFTGVQLNIYWTATTFAYDPTAAWTVDFEFTNQLPVADKAKGSFPVWCVRGPMNADQY